MAALLVSGWIAAPARAADSVYWGDIGDPDPVRVANLGGGMPATLFGAEHSPFGIAIDAAAGKIYWASNDTGKIMVGDLTGGTAHDLFSGEDHPYGLAIDPTAGRLYWADNGSGKIRVGSLSGGAGTDLFTGEGSVSGVALDQTSGKLYWTTTTTHKVRVASSGGGTATDLFAASSNDIGIAIDTTAGFWEPISGTVFAKRHTVRERGRQGCLSGLSRSSRSRSYGTAGRQSGDVAKATGLSLHDHVTLDPEGTPVAGGNARHRWICLTLPAAWARASGLGRADEPRCAESAYLASSPG